MCGSQENHCEKRCEIQGGGQEMAVMVRRLIAKILITTIQANLCCLLHVSLGFSSKFTWIVFIKIFAINLLSQPFLGRHFIFHIFFTLAFLGAAHFFYSWTNGFWIRFHLILFVIVHSKAGILPLMVVVTCLLFFSLCRQIYAVLYMCIMNTF